MRGRLFFKISTVAACALLLGSGMAEGRSPDRRKVEEVERYLPEGSKVYFYEPGARAALVESDLDGDGLKEVVAVHTGRTPSEGDWTPPLTLSVLARSGDDLLLQNSVELKTGMLSVFNVDSDATKFSACDVTGDQRPDMMVLTPGSSLSEMRLRLFNFDGRGLQELGQLKGQIFFVRCGSTRAGAVQEISIDMNERKAYQTDFQWDGSGFVVKKRRPADDKVILVQPGTMKAPF